MAQSMKMTPALAQYARAELIKMSTQDLVEISSCKLPKDSGFPPEFFNFVSFTVRQILETRPDASQARSDAEWRKITKSLRNIFPDIKFPD